MLLLALLQMVFNFLQDGEPSQVMENRAKAATRQLVVLSLLVEIMCSHPVTGWTCHGGHCRFPEYHLLEEGKEHLAFCSVSCDPFLCTENETGR